MTHGLDIGAREKQGNPKVDDGFKVPKEKITCIAASVDVDEEFESSGVEETRKIPKFVDTGTPQFKPKFDALQKISTMTVDEYFEKHPELKKKFDDEIHNDNWGY
ncbi:hypothetical protein GOBAR_DD32124 [Gossypium barbadense]|nr:hypothetical protein GOBAR_DD32124 [Gossypium barbadense]